ncbi:MAG: hypothetical protein ABUL50_10185, partial [Rhizobacter sp.]
LAACAGAGLIAALALLLCAPAQAQSVRKCQIDGRLVFQSSPCPVGAHVVASAAPQAAAAAETATAPKKKTLADLLRERDGADHGRAASREFQGDGANVLRSRMGAV